MKFVETTIFTRRVTQLLDDESYRLLQHALVLRPDIGDRIRHSGGLRKVRWQGKGRGKRGGVRVVYYWAVSQDTILMLFIFGKNEQANLTPSQVEQLKKIVEEEYP